MISSARWQHTDSTLSVMLQLANPLAGTSYPSSFVSPFHKPLKTDSVRTLSGKSHKPTSRQTNVMSPGVDWFVWKHALRAAPYERQYSLIEGEEAQPVPQPLFGGRVPKYSRHTNSNTSTSSTTKFSSGNVHDEFSQRASELSSTEVGEETSRLCKDTEMLPKLANLVEQARERSHCVNELNRVGTFVVGGSTAAMVGRSTSDSSPKCTSAAEPPCANSLPSGVVMDIESNVESPWLLSRRKSKALSTSSTQSLMPSIRSSSSSSAQSSPLCVTPELPPVSLPLLFQSVPTHHMCSGGDVPFDEAQTSSKADVYQLESSVARMTLHPHTSFVDTKASDTTHSHSEHMSTPSPSKSTASLSETNTSWRADHTASYLSRSQRRLARAVINPSCHDVQSYLYEGGQTGVVSGGVMLGPQVQVQRKNPRQGPTPEWKGREQRSRRKSKKMQGNRPPDPKDALSA
ncbi:hypothetical protein GGU10DRAFT_341563 [Lentinula aff. detonsa]|uniref:Uncharacterized protein n=1 Tax=Lentinula aff. detonsa TaxID=2804958 RepID=A0AA38U0Y6_9AGAR|nr:hypothetical protein GGU10DRAFT_341563 [Lentinula aff. detonsa]